MMKGKTDTRRRRKWLWRGAGAGLLALAVAAALPFVFARATVKYALSQSALSDLPLQFEGVTLSPLGALTLRNVVLEDTRESAGKRLATVGTLRVEFNWLGLRGSRVTNIALDDVELTVRPGVDTPFTMLRLLQEKIASATMPATAPGATRPATMPATGEPPFWFDRLLINGKVRIEGNDAWTHAAGIPQTLRLEARITTQGDPQAPTRDFALLLGEVDPQAGAPGAAARGSYASATATGSSVLTLETLAITNLSPAVPPELLSPFAPASLRREVTGRLDRFQMGGRITFGAETQVSLTAEVHDLSLHAGAGVAGASAVPLGVDHVAAAAKVEGKWPGTGAWMRDWTVSPLRVSWEALQVDALRITRGMADLQSDGMELALTDLQANIGDATLAAMAAVDVHTRNFTRARVWLNNIPAGTLAQWLPATMRSTLPGALDGTLAARLHLQEVDTEHVLARVEMSSREGAGLVSAPPATTGAPSPPVVEDAGTRKPRVAWLTNVSVGANVWWNLRTDTLPEITRGRLTADRLELAPPDGSAPLTATRIQSDFGLIRGVARLNDLYANFPDGATLAAQAAYAVNSQTLERATISLLNVDGSLINPWLPGEWGLGGKFDTEVQLTLSRSATARTTAAMTGSVALSPESSVQYGKALLGITAAPTTGAPAPSVAFKLAADWPSGMRMREGMVTVESLAPRGFGAFRIDAASVQSLRDLLKPAAGSGADAVLARIKAGAVCSFADLSVSGHLELGSAPAQTTATLHLAGFSFTAPQENEQEWSVTGVNVNGTAAAPLSADWLAQVRLKDATLQAQRLTAGKNTVNALTTALTMETGKVNASNLAFTYADGGFTGSATASLAPAAQLDGIDLHYKSLNQAIVTAALYPERFTAEGPISGVIKLSRTPRGDLAGNIVVDAEGEGVLKLSRETTANTFAQAAKAAASAEGALIPANFDQIVIEQLANYLYRKGHAEIRDSDQGLNVRLDYARKPLAPGDPGYGVPVTVAGQTVKANVLFNLGGSVTVNNSVENLLKQMLGLRAALLVPPASPPATAPTTLPTTAPATTRP